MLKAAPVLWSVAILEEMDLRRPPTCLHARHTMERRRRAWRADHGPRRAVILRQTYEPGRMGLPDVTDMADLAITIAGQPLEHRRHHVRLVFPEVQDE